MFRVHPAVVLVPLLCGADCSFAAPLPAEQVLFDLSSPYTLQNLTKGNAVVEAARLPGAETPALRIDYQEGTNPSVSFKADDTWNWSKAPGLSFNIHNPGDQTAILVVRLGNKAAEGKEPNLCSAVMSVPAKSNKTFTLDFNKRFPQLTGVGGRIPEPGPTLYTRYDKFDFNAVTSVYFGLDAWTPKTTLYLSDVRVLPEGTDIVPPAAANGLLDKFGQFAWNDWPGKVHVEADFAAQKTAEEADLAANPVMPGRCRFGGWTDGPVLPHNGFFTVTKYQGKWTFVDPDGHLFFSAGVDCVFPGQPSPVTGREALYSWLPEANDPLAFARKTGTGPKGETTDLGMDMQVANLYRKFGPDWDAAWRTTAERRLPSWGFNTIANWSTKRFQTEAKIPYVVTVNTNGKHPYLGSMMDPWDPQYAIDVAAAIAPQAAAVKNDPYCLGYFVDNEMPWAYDNDIAIATLKLDAAKSAGKAAFVEQLKTKYVTIEALNTAWGSELASWEALTAPYTIPKGGAAKMRDDLAAFCKAHALKYFTVVRDAIRANDPNHLYLGCRFAHCTSEAYNAAVEVCDVVSFNIYQQDINEGAWKWLSDQKPTIVGEFHFGALDRGMFRVGMQGAASQQGRGRLFEKYVNSVARNPKFIGCHWFSYSDEPVLGRRNDGENFNIGFISVTDTPYPELVAAARRTLRGIYEMRWGEAPKRVADAGK